MSALQVRVFEIFHSIQGESTWAGLPCVFVRLAGCPQRCVWCDTAYAFEGGDLMSLEEIVNRVAGYRCGLVEVTGGEPLAQVAAPLLLKRLADGGYDVLLETGGSRPIEGIDPRVHVIMDLKCPDSGESGANLWENLAHLKRSDELKFVVASRRDYEWARQVVLDRDLPRTCPVLFSPVCGMVEPRELALWILEDRLRVRLHLQLHRIVFGPDARGV